jgi:hypothetical protein
MEGAGDGPFGREELPMHDEDKSTVPLGPRPIDAKGRLLPISDEERKARAERLLATLAKIEAMGPGETDTDERWRDFMRGIDEGRPERPLFEGQY